MDLVSKSATSYAPIIHGIYGMPYRHYCHYSNRNR